MRRLMHILMALLCALSLPARGADRANTVPQAVEQLHAAMLARDGQALRRLTDERLTYGHSTGTIEDRDAFIDNLVLGKTPFVKLAFADSTIAVRGDVAWVRGVLNAEISNAGGGVDTVAFKVLYVWKKDRTWKLLARQSVR